jgi:hypothetical protein
MNKKLSSKKVSKFGFLKNPVLGIVGLVIGVMLGAGLIVKAYSGTSPKVVMYGNYIEAQEQAVQGQPLTFQDQSQEQPVDENSDGENLGKAVFDTQYLNGNMSVAGISTLNQMSLGTQFSNSLNFSVGKLGGINSIKNNGGNRLCTMIQVKISTGSTTGGLLGTGSPFTISVATSTSATAFSSGSSASLIASTTIPTSTTPLFSGIANKGTGNAIAGQTWEWKANEYVNFTVGSLYGGLAATSTAFTNMAGKYYIHCVNQ